MAGRKTVRRNNRRDEASRTLELRPDDPRGPIAPIPNFMVGTPLTIEHLSGTAQKRIEAEVLPSTAPGTPGFVNEAKRRRDENIAKGEADPIARGGVKGRRERKGTKLAQIEGFVSDFAKETLSANPLRSGHYSPIARAVTSALSVPEVVPSSANATAAMEDLRPKSAIEMQEREQAALELGAQQQAPPEAAPAAPQAKPESQGEGAFPFPGQGFSIDDSAFPPGSPGTMTPNFQTQEGQGLEQVQPVDPIQERMMDLLNSLSEEDRREVPQMSTTATVFAALQAGLDPEGFRTITMPLIARNDALAAQQFEQKEALKADAAREIGILAGLRRLQLDEQGMMQEIQQQQLENAQIAGFADQLTSKYLSALPGVDASLGLAAAAQAQAPTPLSRQMMAQHAVNLSTLRDQVGAQIATMASSGLPPTKEQLTSLDRSIRDLQNGMFSTMTAIGGVQSLAKAATGRKLSEGKAIIIGDGTSGVQLGLQALSYFRSNMSAAGLYQGNLPKFLQNEETKVFGSMLQAFNAPIRKFFAGVAVNQQEFKRNEKFLPEINFDRESIETGLTTSLGIAIMKLESELRSLERAGFNVVADQEDLEILKQHYHTLVPGGVMGVRAIAGYDGKARYTNSPVPAGSSASPFLVDGSAPLIVGGDGHTYYDDGQ